MPAYRPKYWVVAAVAAVLAGLAIAVLMMILVLWDIAGALTTITMVLAYAAAMFGLWRIGVSRL